MLAALVATPAVLAADASRPRGVGPDREYYIPQCTDYEHRVGLALRVVNSLRILPTAFCHGAVVIC